MPISKKLRRYKGWIAVLVLVAIAGIAYLLLRPSPAEEATTTYETQAVAVSTISSTVSGTGNLEVFDATEVWPQVNGTVASVNVAEGELVAAGAVLYTLDSSSAEENSAKAYSAYKQAQASVEQAESQVLKAQNTLDALSERSEEPSSTVSDSEIEAAEKDIEVAEASLASAKASLNSAQLACNNAEAAEAQYVVKAPVDGVVWSLAIEAGDSVSAGSGATGASATSGQAASSSSAPLTLAPDEPLAVRLTINEVEISAIKIDQRADIEFDALSDLMLTGKVIEVADEGTNDQGVVTYDVWIALDVIDDSLRSGMSAAASIVTNVARDVLVVPNAAIERDDEDATYVTVLKDGEPTSTYVTVGISSATQTVIEGGIEEGTEVVTQIVESGGEEESNGGAGFALPGMGGGGPGR